MTIKIFGSRVHNDIAAQLERSLQVRRHKSVIANHARAGTMCDLADLFQIGNDHDGIGWRFKKHHLCIWFDGGFDVKRVGSVNVIKLEIVICEYTVKKS